MGKCIRKRAALLLTAAVLATILPFGIFARKEQADTKDIKLNLTEVQGKYGQINIYTPNVDGKLKSLIFVNGSGGPKVEEYAPYIEQWMKDGYIKPMVVFMPFFDDSKTDIPGFSKGMDSLVKAIKDKTYEEKIGKTIDTSELTVCGYSMGGSIAACAGCFYKDDFVNVGAFSPSPQLHYPCGGKYVVKGYCPFLYEYPGLDCNFSTASDKHLLLIGGDKEGDLTDGLEYGYNRYGKDQGFAKMVFHGDNESHGHPLFRKELFCYMYYIQNDDLPSDELIHKLFSGNYTIERVMPDRPDAPTPTNTNTPTPTNTNTPVPTNTDTPTPTNTATPTSTVTSAPELTLPAEPTTTAKPTEAAVTVTPTTGITVTPSATPSATEAPAVTDAAEPAADLKAGGNSYSIDGSENVVFKAADPKITDLNIPSTVKIGGKKYKVTAIAAGAFKGNKKIRSAVIGKNIRSIGADAFRDCKKLKKVVFKTVKLKKSTVGKNAFKGIAKKATFTLPEKKYKSYKKILPKTAKGTRITFLKR